MVDPATEAFYGGGDVVGGFRPPEGFRIPVAPFDEGADIRFGLPCWGTDAPLEPFPRRFGEPAPDLIGPGSRGRRETDVPTRPPRRPCPDGGGPGGGVVVHDDTDIRPLGDAGTDPLREVREPRGPVAPAALADDEAGGDIERGERRGRPVAPAVAGPPFGNARAHRRHGLRAVGRPYPALPIDAEHDYRVRRRRMEAHDVADLVRERGIAGGPEGLRRVRL